MKKENAVSTCKSTFFPLDMQDSTVQAYVLSLGHLFKSELPMHYLCFAATCNTVLPVFALPACVGEVWGSFKSEHKQ